MSWCISNFRGKKSKIGKIFCSNLECFRFYDRNVFPFSLSILNNRAQQNFEVRNSDLSVHTYEREKQHDRQLY